MAILSVLVFATVLALPGMFIALMIPCRFEEALPAGILGLDLILFLSGIIGFLKAGAVFICVLALLLAVVLIFTLVRHSDKRIQAIQQVFTPAFFLYWALVLVLIFFSYGKLMTSWDEFSHWGDTVKAMTITGALGTDPANQAIFPDYPPAMSLIQYLAQILMAMFTGKSFTEWILYTAYHLFLFSLFFPFLNRFSFRSGKYWLLIICLFLLPTCFQEQVYSKIYIDTFLGALFGVGIALLLLQNRSRIQHIYFFLILAVLPLTKTTGILFSVALLVLFCYDVFCLNAPHKTVCIACCISSVVIPELLWQINVHLNSTSQTSSLNAVLSGFSSFSSDSWALTITKRFITALFTQGIESSDAMLPWCSAAVACLLLFTVLSILLRHNKQKGQTQRGSFVFLSVLAITLLVFICGTCAATIYTFSREDAETLDSFARYLNTVFYAYALAALLLGFQLWNNKQINGKPFLAVLVITALCLVPWIQVARFITRRDIVYSENYRAPTEAIAAEAEKASVAGGNIFVVYQDSDIIAPMMLRTRLRPATVTYGTLEGKTIADLKQYNAIILLDISDSFIQHYGFLFEEETDIQANGIYAVSADSGLMWEVACTNG